MLRKTLLSISISGLLISAAMAQQTIESEAEVLDRVEVKGAVVFRDRTDDIAPTLTYDNSFFQQFEPLTVGDMLKRVPGVAFVSDVLEFDGARLRGLNPGYTQVLINGKKVPGAGDDRSFYVDRIPAEMVERIEIIRSSSANRSGDAVAGALNIILRDAYLFDDDYLRVGGLYFDDGEVKPSLGGVWSQNLEAGSFLAGINMQGRYNPKQKTSFRFDEPGGDFDNREDQSDIRDGTDYSGNLSFNHRLGDGELSLSAMYVKTDRTETERSLEFNDRKSVAQENLISENDQVTDIDQSNSQFEVSYEFGMAGGTTEIDFVYSKFTDDTDSVEEETAFDDDDDPPSFDGFEGERTESSVDDSEYLASIAHSFEVFGSTEIEFGLDANWKKREAGLRTSEAETDVPGQPLPPYEIQDVSNSLIEERRFDPYIMFTQKGVSFSVEAGLRYEMTDSEVGLDGNIVDNDYSELLPSLNMQWRLSDNDRITTSLAKTVRRPSFNYLSPLYLEGEYGDNDFIGNPELKQETALGLDLGYEHRLGRFGVVGINGFYRSVDSLIEIVSTGLPSEQAIEDFEEEVEEFLDQNPGADENTPGFPAFEPDSFLYTSANVGNGEVYGFEFDLSTPLTAIGLPNTGLFANYTWLDSSVEDRFGDRRFNDQAEYVYNVGFIQDLPEAGFSFGASYRRQGDAYSRLLAEEVVTVYGADLEVFMEKRFGDKFVLRLTGSNLLDASKDEFFNKFDTEQDQIDRDFDEYEEETETAGPVFQMVARYTF